MFVLFIDQTYRFHYFGLAMERNHKINAKYIKSLTIVLTLLLTVLAGCLDSDDGSSEAEQKIINIAGSSTVYPVASAWGTAYSAANTDYTVTVAGGGSGGGLQKYAVLIQIRYTLET